jgi:hypothetical protein
VARNGVKGAPPKPREVPVTLAPDAEHVGLAGMLADLIRQNVEQNPGKRTDFEKLRTIVYIHVRDAEVATTLVFDGGSLVVHGGAYGEADIRISGDAESILALCMVKIIRGMPHPLHRHNRAIVRRILRGEIRIEGIPRSPGQLLRFTRLMTVRV